MGFEEDDIVVSKDGGDASSDAAESKGEGVSVCSGRWAVWGTERGKGSRIEVGRTILSS